MKEPRRSPLSITISNEYKELITAFGSGSPSRGIDVLVELNRERLEKAVERQKKRTKNN